MTEILINGSQGKLQGFYKHSENSSNIGLVLHPRNCLENSMDNNIVSSFAIYPSSHKQSFFYSLKLSHAIQTLEKK